MSMSRRRSASPRFALAAGLATAVAGCDAILGLGEEPNQGITSGTGTDTTSSGAGSTGTETVVASATQTSVSSGEQGGGGNGGDATSSSQSVSSGSGGGTGGTGAGGSEVPTGDCGPCAEDADCASSDGAPAVCDFGTGRCRVRSIDVTSDAVEPGGARGLPLRGPHVAFIKRTGAVAWLVTVNVEAGTREELDVVGGGSVVATDSGFAYLSLGASGLVQPSELLLFTCSDDICLSNGPATLTSVSPYFSALGWLGDGRFITSVNTGSGALRILSPRTEAPTVFDECPVDANDAQHAPFKFAVEGDLAAWSRVRASGGPGEAIETLMPTACDGTSEEHFTFDERPSTIGIAIHGGDIAYTGTEGGPYRAWVNDEPVVRADAPATPISVGYVPGIAFRPDGSLLVPGEAGEEMWDCDLAGAEYACDRYDFPAVGALTDVYEVAADEGRVVTLSRTIAGYRVTCIDESSSVR
jgi:hypothetical protein